MPEIDELFEEYRTELHRLAYRMLGSLADADDVMQEAFLRWSRADQAAIKSPRAYLMSMVTRLCIDQRRAVEARKENYVGPWLPEPLVESTEPAAALETAEAVSMAFLVVLESLSPLERAAYLLRRVFDYGYDEIAEALQRSEAACRQLVSRAEERVHQRRPRFESSPSEAERLTVAFMDAIRRGDLNDLVGLLAADAIMVSDSGGKVPAARAPVYGADRVARFFLGLMKKAPPNLEVRRVRVNGEPGIMTLLNGRIENLLTLDIVDGHIAAVYVWRNPDKLPCLEAK